MTNVETDVAFEIDPAGLYALIAEVVHSYGPYEFTKEQIKNIGIGRRRQLFFAVDPEDEEVYLLGAAYVETEEEDVD